MEHKLATETVSRKQNRLKIECYLYIMIKTEKKKKHNNNKYYEGRKKDG